MKIYSMTATFGKLEHQTLTLQPGLNIIEAPNEWGKSTWCAFLVNMLYGIDTRARTTGTVLADKERYAPWSGTPMAGRIDLNWNGRDITIERSTKGRVIFGNFRAFETETGIEVPELNGTNCGQQLLGVERSVFTRAGFLRQNDLAVTQDDSLRRRLNNLVTTGDESGAGDKLSQTLKDLKNKCRYNRSGLLPQAENERDQLKNQLSDLHGLQNQAEQIRSQQAMLAQRIGELENHADALRYEAARENLRKVSQAEEELEQAKQRLSAMMTLCEALPGREEIQKNIHRARALREQLLSLQMEERMLPALPEDPNIPEAAMDVAAAEQDEKQYAALEKSRKANTALLVAALAAAAVLALCGVLLPKLTAYLLIAAAVVGIAGIAVSVLRGRQLNAQLEMLRSAHAGVSPDGWAAAAQHASQEYARYQVLLSNANALRSDLQERQQQVLSQVQELTDGDLQAYENSCAAQIAAWDALADARRDLQSKENHYHTLRSMVHPVEPAKRADGLHYSQEETAAILAQARVKQQQLHTALGQCQGQTEALGSESMIRARLDTLNSRIDRLEDTYYALEMAQDALRDATNQLQRRFAPRISKRAQELFGRLTHGRYQRLSLGQDLSLSTSAENEDILRSSQWRSDGTADQLYLALRLAVAEELTPEAPLILDDAFVRFDDQRLREALQILKEESADKQVIVFTCQSREKAMEDLL